jgi:hypothetical protein
LVEHATENRSVGGSIPPLGTIKLMTWLKPDSAGVASFGQKLDSLVAVAPQRVELLDHSAICRKLAPSRVVDGHRAPAPTSGQQQTLVEPHKDRLIVIASSPVGFRALLRSASPAWSLGCT